MELHREHWKAEEKRPRRILLLHGLCGRGKIWKPIAISLDGAFDIMAPDQRGHGLSQLNYPANYSPNDYAKDVLETVSVNDFSPFWVVGHSMGARTAIATALLSPEKINGVVLIDLTFSGLAAGIGSELKVLLGNLPTRFSSRAEAKDYLFKVASDPSIALYLLANSEKDTKTGEIRFPFDFNAIQQTISEAENFDMRKAVQEFTLTGKPVYVLRGGKSLAWPKDAYEEEKKRFADQKNVKFIEFENSGHGLPFEERVLFVEKLKEWTSP